jgi:hypothetical protein
LGHAKLFLVAPLADDGDVFRVARDITAFAQASAKPKSTAGTSPKEGIHRHLCRTRTAP